MKSFNEIYANVHKKCNDDLEMARQATIQGNIFSLVIIGVIAIFFTIITRSVYGITLGFVAWIFCICFNKKSRIYTKMFKENVIKTFVKEYSSNLDFIPYRGISRHIYSEGEFEHFDIFDSEDNIIGTLENGNVMNMSEVHTQDEYTDSDGDTQRTTLFHGLFAVVELQKLVNANIKIRKDKLLFEGKNKVEMDSGEFEKIYTVFSTNNIIAMQLLTADIMQMFIDFKIENKIMPELTIKGNKMYIRFHTGNVFEANILKKALDFDTLARYYNIITFTLKLTEKMIKNIQETEI